jgi:anti-anti-sigma factor
MRSLALNEVRRLDGNLVLIASGVVDDATVECFEKGLDRASGAGFERVIVDLTGCRLDSAGLAALVRLRRRSSGDSGDTRLVVPDRNVLRMLQIVGLTPHLPTYRTVAAALRLRSSTHAGPRGQRRGPAPLHASPGVHGRRGTLPPRRPVRRASRPAWIESGAGDG